jgi:hypothetical protein
MTRVALYQRALPASLCALFLCPVRLTGFERSSSRSMLQQSFGWTQTEIFTALFRAVGD